MAWVGLLPQSRELIGGVYFAHLQINSMAEKAVMGLFFVGWGLLLVAFGICFGLLKMSTRGVEDAGHSSEQLDERQMQARGLVYEQACKTGVGLLTIVLAAGVAWAAMTQSYPPKLVILPVGLVTFQLAGLLPTLIAAWHNKV